MNIDREELTSLLVEKSGLDEEEVRSQLDTLMERIRQAAEEGKSFEIEGFGTFRMEEEELRFEPSETLSTEINQKYAGMKPIELIGAFKEQGDEDAEEGDRDDVVAADGPESRKSENFELDREAAGDADSRRSRIKARAAKARREAARRSEGDGEKEPKEAEKKKKPASSGKAATASPAADSSDGGETEPGTRTTGKTGREHIKTSREKDADVDSISRFVAAALIIIALAAAGWMAWDAGLFTAQEQEAGLQSPLQEDSRPSLAQEEGQAGAGDQTTGQDEQEGTQTGEDATEQTEDENVSTGDGQAAASAYGLTGEFNGDLPTYYTIVVHSLQQQSGAEEHAGQLRNEGYRVVTRPATVEGTQYWRVGIGQFQTVSDAQQAAEGLPEPYRTNHFIRNIP